MGSLASGRTCHTKFIARWGKGGKGRGGESEIDAENRGSGDNGGRKVNNSGQPT